MAEYLIQEETLTDIADTLRKHNTFVTTIPLSDFSRHIEDIAKIKTGKIQVPIVASSISCRYIDKTGKVIL